jgi:hypothetical protein
MHSRPRLPSVLVSSSKVCTTDHVRTHWFNGRLNCRRPGEVDRRERFCILGRPDESLPIVLGTIVPTPTSEEF